MIKRLSWILFVILSVKAQAQYKPDVIVLGGSAAGTAAAIQAARSGVKTLLIEPGDHLIGDLAPLMNVPSFDRGLWKEWKDAYKKASDSTFTDPRAVLEKMVKNTKDLDFLKSTEVTGLEQKKNGWEVKLIINGKVEDVRCKVLVDASTDSKNSILARENIITYDKNGKFQNLVSYDKTQQIKPYDQLNKLYRTSAAAGFGKDSSSLFAIPLGVYIPIEKENLLIISMSAFKDFETEDLRNIALWVNMGQSVGALAAYGPFFDTTPAKANIRMTQGEMFTYKSFLYPVLDVRDSDYAWYPIQKIIASGILKFDFQKGLFHPQDSVKTSDIKAVMAELYPRSRIWFIDNNKVTDLTVSNVISLLSFTSGRDAISIANEVKTDWKEKYQFDADFDEHQLLSRKEFSVLISSYMEPFNIRVDFNGFFLR